MPKRSLRSVLLIAAIALGLAGMGGTAVADTGSATTTVKPDSLLWPNANA